MPASRPRRIRLIIILVILGNIVQGKLDDGHDGTIQESVFAQLCRSYALMKIDDANLNTAQAAVWTDIDSLATAYTDATPTDAWLTTFSSTFAGHLTAAGL